MLAFGLKTVAGLRAFQSYMHFWCFWWCNQNMASQTPEFREHLEGWEWNPWIHAWYLDHVFSYHKMMCVPRPINSQKSA
jgi:hypothetical protein